jgi:hypothetical protein
MMLDVNAFVLVSNFGDITLLGPIDIDPALEDPKINFRKDGNIKWTLQSMNKFTIASEGVGQDFVVTGGFQNQNMIILTPLANAYFNTTMSVYGKVEFGDDLRVYK